MTKNRRVVVDAVATTEGVQTWTPIKLPSPPAKGMTPGRLRRWLTRQMLWADLPLGGGTAFISSSGSRATRLTYLFVTHEGKRGALVESHVHGDSYWSELRRVRYTRPEQATPAATAAGSAAHPLPVQTEAHQEAVAKSQ